MTVPHTVHGLVPILAIPFQPDGSLDLPSLRRLTEFQLASGVDGVAVFGMASEAFALTADERSSILAEVVRVVDDAVPVVAGVSATSTVTAIEQARAAAAGGADGLMVLPPYLVKPNPGQLVDFYRDVAASVDLEIMVQDAPAATGVAMSPWIIVELSKIDGVTSVKVEAPPTAPKVAALADALGATDVLGAADSSRDLRNLDDGDQFAILGGQNAQFCLEEYARGAVGTMPACEFPDLLAPILADWNAGRRPEARAAFARLLPLILFGLQPGIAWAVHKEVLVARGLIDHATVRSPARPLDDAGRASLDLIMEDLTLR